MRPVVDRNVVKRRIPVVRLLTCDEVIIFFGAISPTNRITSNYCDLLLYPINVYLLFPPEINF